MTEPEKKIRQDVIWCREKPFCVAWSWNPRIWTLGLYRMRFDALDYWSFGLGPLVFYNDYDPE